MQFKNTSPIPCLKFFFFFFINFNFGMVNITLMSNFHTVFLSEIFEVVQY